MSSNLKYSNNRHAEIGDWVLATEPFTFRQHHGQLKKLFPGFFTGEIKLKNGQMITCRLDRMFGPVSEFE